MRLSRRDVLNLSGSAVVAGLFPRLSRAASMTGKRVIPVSGESLPVIGLGTSRVFDVGDDDPEISQCSAVLRTLIESGGSLVDSSPMYRRAEAVSGGLAADLGITDDIFWATKVWTDGASDGAEQMRRSLELFRTDQIDLMQIHNLRDWKTHLETLRQFREEGLIRYIGITHSRTKAFDDVESGIRATELDFVQINYSLGEREAENRLLPLCADKGIATLINRPFMKGAMFKKVRDKAVPEWAREFGAESWGQFFLKFILAQPPVTCVIPATRNPAHMLDNLAAGAGAPPDRSQRQAMIGYFSSL
jgi:diketogulonate reductase-like aldo/keto reductase